MAFMKPYLTLCRVNIALFAACSGAMGFFLAPRHSMTDALIMSVGILLLAGGASALNQFQERDIDAKMERTSGRPLPSGTISPGHALFFALSLMIIGLPLLAFAGNATASWLGLAAVLCYNGIYTSLKKVTAFAAVPGAAIGMIPPAIGWVSGNGSFFDARLGAVCFIFFLWQVPHFWLLLLCHGEEYQKAGLPALNQVMSRGQIAHVIYAWILASTVATLLLPLYGVVRSPIIFWPLSALAAWLVWHGRVLAARQPLLFPFSQLFRKINVYLFFVMSLLILGNVL
jgi:protoheme IX farnesyltransferase